MFNMTSSEALLSAIVRWMEIAYLLLAGIPISLVHGYLVWHHSDNRKRSISEHAILDRKSHIIYIFAHLFTVFFFMLYSYQFFLVEHELVAVFVLNLIFAVLDIVQAFVPSRGKTEAFHTAAAYFSWLSYVVSGLIALLVLDISEPYKQFAILTMIPVLGLFIYMHIKRTKLYPYQLLMVPLYVLVLLFITIGA